MKLIVVSGLSGAGKSVALQVLEDQGFYCVDNLPLVLLPKFAEQMIRVADQHEMQKFAVGIDARNFVSELSIYPELIAEVEAQGLQCETVFLEAADDVLITRFSETRRRHPLSRGDAPLVEAIMAERDLLSVIADEADLRLDTSHLNVHQLRSLINNRVIGKQQGLSMQFLSFGFKKGVPADADFVFDVRCLPNPYWDPALRGNSGRDPQVVAFLEREEMVLKMFADVRDYLEAWVAVFAEGGRSYLTVAIGCTGGRHRSVYMAEKLAGHFAARYRETLVRHRELS